MYDNYIFDLYGTLVDIRTNENKTSLWKYMAVSLTYIRLYKGAKPLLNKLRHQGKGIYLLSNAQRLFTEPELRSLRIYDLFDDVMISSDIGFKKPSPLFYDALIEKHGLDPKASVMIGNDWQADAWGAHNSGLASMYIHTVQSPELAGDLPRDCRRLNVISDVLIQN